VGDAPGDYFFVRRFDLPAGLPEAEVAGFVELQLEELSPFPLEQLYYGHLVSSGRDAVLVYAAYRRRFAAEQVERWARSTFVFPDFAPALRLRFDRPTVVLFRSQTALTGMRFDGPRELPVHVVSRPLPIEADDDQARAVREQVVARLGAVGEPLRDLRVTSAPESRAQGLAYVLGPDAGGGGAAEVLLPTAECWAMDVRDASFVSQQRRRMRVDLVLWRCVLGAAAAVALLVLGELLLLGGRGYAGWLAGRVRDQAPIVASLEDKHTVANRLADFGESGLSPFVMLATASGPKPASVYFTRATAEGRNNLTIDAITRNVADMNAFEAGLRSLPEVERAEVQNSRAQEDGTTFSVVIQFKSGAFARSPGPERAALVAGGGS
jgi:hypothetical protein